MKLFPCAARHGPATPLVYLPAKCDRQLRNRFLRRSTAVRKLLLGLAGALPNALRNKQLTMLPTATSRLRSILRYCT